MANKGTKSHSGKVAFITGGASGIGRAASIAFAREGANVAIADVSVEGARQTARTIEELGGQALIVRCDVSQAEDVRTAVEKTAEKFGRLDCAFNNAGIEEKIGITAELSIEDWDRILSVNLRGVFLCMKYQIPLMLKQGAGAIVNCASVAGLVGFHGVPAYAASKHGVVGLTKTAALDYAKFNLRINAVCPGMIETPMMERLTGGTAQGRREMIELEPIERMGRPEEVAAAVLWLCSEGASFVTGHAMPVDGGFSTR